MMIQTQAWSRLNQEPSAEPAGHSKKMWIGKDGVLITKNEDENENEERWTFDQSNQLYLRDNLFLPAGILSSVSAEWSDDCQAKRGD